MDVLCEVDLLYFRIILYFLPLVNILLHIIAVLWQGHSATVKHRVSAMGEAF